MKVPADQGVRDQIRSRLDVTLFVEAGAGSGKTTSLVERLLALVLDEQVPIEAIAAITFTEGAAAELRVRARAELEAISGRGDPRADSARRALEGLDAASLSTLHAFAYRILMQFPIEAGLPPAVEVLDEVTSMLEFERRCSALDLLLLDELDEPTVRLLLAAGMDHHRFAPVAATFDQNWDLLEIWSQSVPPMPEVPAEIDLTPVAMALAGLDAACANCTKPEDSLLRFVLERRPHVVALLAETDPLRVLGLLRTIPPLVHGGRGTAANWGGAEAKQEVLNLGRGVNAAVDAVWSAITARVLERCAHVVAQATLAAAEDRRRAGRLSFHDLLVLARRLLRTNPRVQSVLHSRYQRLLIDEFQDTDPIQAELAVRIAADSAASPDLDWRRIPVAPGRLFFVGDPKQSIYRFRRADIALFMDVANLLEVEPVQLVANFRSVGPIVDFVNKVFTQVMNLTPGAQPAYEPLVAHRDSLAGDPGPPVLIFGGPHETKVGHIREREAADVVRIAARARDEGWLVRDEQTGEVRPARLGDICVLLPSRNLLPYLQKAFDVGDLAYRTETGTLVYSSNEIDELFRVLAAFDMPNDPIAVVGALRTAIYGCGDDDLYCWHSAGGGWAATAGLTPPAGFEDSPVAEALRDIGDRSRASRHQSPSEVVGDLIRDRRLMASALAHRRPRDLWRRYRIVIDHARRFADVEQEGLRGFLRWARLQTSDTVRVTEPFLVEPDNDAVRVMTIHGSKGLEFPIVILAGSSTLWRSPHSGPRVVFGFDGSFEIGLQSNVVTGEFDARRDAEDQMSDHERIRLLYVGLTRARDHLVVSTHHKAGSASHGGCLHEAVAGLGVVRDDPDLVVPSITVADDEEPAPLDAQQWWTRRAAWVAEHQALAAGVGRGGGVTATAVAALMADNAGPFTSDAGLSPEPWMRGRGGTGVGSAVHSVLHLADLERPSRPQVDALARARAAIEGVPDAAEAVAAKAWSAISSDLVTGAVAGGRWWREVHVAAPIGGDRVLEGFVDLLFDTPEGLVVVDYKTDAVSRPEEVVDAVHRYAPQGAAYAMAVARSAGRAVVKVVFLFLHDDGVTAAELGDLEGWVAKVTAVLEVRA